MKICPNCGNSLQGDEKFCSSCGAKQYEQEQAYNQDNQSYGQQQAYNQNNQSYGQQQAYNYDNQSYGQKYSYSYSHEGANRRPAEGTTNGFAIAGFILSIVGLFWEPLAILGLILSCLGLRACKRRGAGAYGLAMAGFVISIIGVAILIIAIIIEVIAVLTFTSYGFYF